MTAVPDTTARVLSVGRWVAALAVRGLFGGVTHAVVATVVSAAIQLGEGAGDVPGLLAVGALVGAVVGVMLATIVGLVTAPMAIRAVARGGWGRMRPWVIGLPAAAIIVMALFIAPPWPTEPVDPFILSDFLMSVVWLYAGPACWAAWFLYRLTGRWPRQPAGSR